jgi:hypothetical protein
MFEVNFEYDGSLEGLDEELKVAIAAKLTELTNVLYDKVIDNVSGKILKKQTGELASSIRQEVDTEADVMIGTVFPSPASAKAWALEKGGEKSYVIVPTKATILKFFWDKVGQTVFFTSVNHPPSKEFAYLRLALEEMETLVPDGFREAIQTVLDRR